MTWGLWGHTASTATKDNWESGETAHYEYHCLQSPESSDYHLWQRSHQPVQVLGPSANAEDFSEDFPTFGERADEGLPRVYRVRFNDGHEDDAWEDELLTHPDHFQARHAPPRTAARTAMPWYHVSPHDFPDGTVLTPGGGPSLWDKVPYEQGGNAGSPEFDPGPKISDYVWLDGDRETSDFRREQYQELHGHPVHQYEVSTEHDPEDFNGEYAVPQAVIKRRVSRRIAMPWRIEHPDYQPADVAHDYNSDLGSVRGGGDSRNYLVGPANNVWWHGSASGDIGGGGRDIGLHVGDYQTAAENLNNILEPNPLHPQGRWIGRHSLSEAYLDFYDDNGDSIPRWQGDRHLFTHPDGTPMHGSYRPNVFPVAITGPMGNTTDTAVSDGQAHALMRRQHDRPPKTPKGYYYVNAGEGLGESSETGIVYPISATVPSANHVEKLDPAKYEHIAEEADQNWETYDPPSFSDEEKKKQERGVREWRDRRKRENTAARIAMPDLHKAISDFAQNGYSEEPEWGHGDCLSNSLSFMEGLHPSFNPRLHQFFLPTVSAFPNPARKDLQHSESDPGHWETDELVDDGVYAPADHYAPVINHQGRDHVVDWTMNQFDPHAKVPHIEPLDEYSKRFSYDEPTTEFDTEWKKEARIMTAAVTVYTKPNCPQCMMTKKQLDKLGIDHDTVDVTQDPDAHAYVSGLGYQSAPVVVVGDGERHWGGFSPDKIKALMQ